MPHKRVRLICAEMLAIVLVSAAAFVPTNAGPPAATSAVSWIDDFDSSSLNGRWAWIREDPTHWSLTANPGFLRITTQAGAPITGANLARNLLVQQAPGGDFELQSHVLFTPTENAQSAGLVVYQSDGNYFAVIRAYCGFDPPCKGNAIYFEQQEQNHLIGSMFPMTTTAPGDTYLRVVRHAVVYTGSFSLNGINWTTLGAHTVVSGFVPSKIGLAAFNDEFIATEIPADFDFFRLDDNSNFLFLPAIRR